MGGDLRGSCASRIRSSKRVVIKAGTSVVSTPEGYPSLVRLANIVEQVCSLIKEGREVLLVTSGAVGIGRQLLSKQQRLSLSVRDIVNGQSSSGKSNGYDSACAAAGQLGLMSLYENLFSTREVATSQVLVTSYDFTSVDRRENIQYCVNSLLQLGVVPIINENDAVSANKGYTPSTVFSDNDSLAALVAKETGAELLILLTDVAGVYDNPPTHPGAKLLPVYQRDTSCAIGDKSAQGRGGMMAKITAALAAVDGGVENVVIASGHQPGVIYEIAQGTSRGTLFSRSLLVEEAAAIGGGGTSPKHGSGMNGSAAEEDGAEQDTIRAQAVAAREGQRSLANLDSQTRSEILRAVAKALTANSAKILEANELDMEEARRANIAGPLLKRLALSEAKIATLADGINSLAEMEEPVGRVVSRSEVSAGLELTQTTVPIGVLLIVFESRPDSLPQIASLALRSGNGLLLKGGKEAHHSNSILHSLIVDAVVEASGGRVSRDVIGLVTSRADVSRLLELDDVIDLVIPRGSSELVKSIKSSTRIPVLGHAEGVCHVYVDKAADARKAVKLVVDSKTDYPAACNAAETLLLHQDLVTDPTDSTASLLLRSLMSAGVTVLGGPSAVKHGLVSPAHAVSDLKMEYGDLTICVEVVEDLQAAVDHIHKYGSSHTDAIVTEDEAAAAAFLQSVDSACVFHNASTRFADGFRFGLGAEVGISTGKIHARGPVGVEGLLTTKWLLKSEAAHAVKDFSDGTCKYTHKKLPISTK